MKTPHTHSEPHAFVSLNGRAREGLTVCSRRGMLKAGLAGMAGLSLTELVRLRAEAAQGGRAMSRGKSVILLWMAGGPSHLDTWDPKPDAPREIRGPFATIATKIPGVRLCEYLPKQAAMLDQMTIIRSVDCRFSNHQPNTVMQTANLEAEPRLNPRAAKYPGFQAVVAKYHGANQPGLPPAVHLNVRDKTHFAWAGYLGKQHEPFIGDNVGKLLELPGGLTMDRLQNRQSLAQQLDRLRREVDASGAMDAMDRYGQQAYEIIAGARAQAAFDVTREPARVLERYGGHEWSQKALLARRLVEAGVSFVTIDLSNHSASGTWDTHGDNIPPYGGIWNGLRPLLPVFDHVLTTLVGDLRERGMLDDTLVLAMGEFGRSPQLGTQGSTDGRNHWPHVMSMTLAGGGFHHGQVIGATERDGGQIVERPVTPGDLAATIYQHMGVPLDATYLDHQQRPRLFVESGEPIRELVG